MTTLARLLAAAGWLLALVLGVLYLQLRAQEDAPARHAAGLGGERPVDARPAPSAGQAQASDATGELGLLRACREQLKRAADRGCDATRLLQPSREDLTKGVPRPSAVAVETAKMHAGSAGGPAVAEALAGSPPAREVADQLLAALAGTPPGDAVALTELTCAASDMRRVGLAELKVALAAPEAERAARVRAATDEIKRQREVLLQDLEARMGKQAYAQLRAAGGLGLLSEVLDCRD